MKFKRIILIIMDSVGIGAMPDAADFGDSGADTLGSIDRQRGLHLPRMETLGLGTLRSFQTIKPRFQAGAYATTMMECSAGKDTITGHWEFMGIIQEQSFPVYPNGFPDELMDRFTQVTGYEALGNKPASGTAIIQELGAAHMQSGKPIVYTSADSVFQIAACESVMPLEELYRICTATREQVTVGKHAVSRVIARPFVQTGDGFVRTENRKDYSLEPPHPTALDLLHDDGLDVGAIGKIEDMFNRRGITRSIHSHNNAEAWKDLTGMLADIDSGLVFANFVDFDMLYGHRRDVQGYGDALEAFDTGLNRFLDQAVSPEDLVLITADHGCDPAFKGTDHTRERVPLLVYSPGLDGSGNLPERTCFTDIAVSILDNFRIEHPFPGQSFLGELK